MAVTHFRLMPRDLTIVRAAWSLGYAQAAALRALTSPNTGINTFRNRLFVLRRQRYLSLNSFVLPAGGGSLYSVGPAGLPPTDPRPWRPGIGQILHTVELAEALVALTRPGFAAPLQVTGWQGEAELRSWGAATGAPRPGGRVTWSASGAAGSWLLELGRETDSRAAWRRRLVRYLAVPQPELVLAIAPSARLAQEIAYLAAELGVPLLATTSADLRYERDPEVLDAQLRRRRVLSLCRLC